MVPAVSAQAWDLVSDCCMDTLKRWGESGAVGTLLHLWGEDPILSVLPGLVRECGAEGGVCGVGRAGSSLCAIDISAEMPL